MDSHVVQWLINIISHDDGWSQHFTPLLFQKPNTFSFNTFFYFVIYQRVPFCLLPSSWLFHSNWNRSAPSQVSRVTGEKCDSPLRKVKWYSKLIDLLLLEFILRLLPGYPTCGSSLCCALRKIVTIVKLKSYITNT